MNRRIWLVALFVFIIAIISSGTTPAAADAGASITGVVASANGGVIQGATVELIGPSGSSKTTSGKDGSFSFTGLPAGTYVLRAGAKLYQTASSPPLVLGAGQTLSLQVSLQPVTTTNISTLGRVTVTGHPTLNTSAAPSFTISANQMLNQGALQLNSALEAQNGVTMERYSNGAPGAVTTFSIRGAGGFGGGNDGTGNTGYEILVLQDGEPMRNGQFGDFDTSALTPAIYSRVEVVKGVGGASIFGANTIGGTINLVTRDPAKTEGGEFILGYGGFGTSDFNISETNTLGRFGYLFDVHRYATDGFVPWPYLASYQTFATPIVAHPTQTFDLKSGLAKLRYDFSGYSYLVVDASLESDYRDQLGLIGNPNLTSTGAVAIDPTNGLPSFFGFPGDFVWNMQPKYSADFHTTVAGGSLILRSYTQYLQRVVDGLNEPPLICCFQTRSVDHLTGDLLSWTKSLGHHTVTLGLGANSDNFYFANNAPSFGYVTFAQMTPTAQGSELYRTYLVRDDYTASPKVDVTLALFYSNYNTVLVKRLDPRLAAVFKPDQNSVLRASVGSGFAAPRLSDLFTKNPDLSSRDGIQGPTCPFFPPCVAIAGNPGLKAETAVGADIGYQRLFGNVGQANIDLYRTNLTNHIFAGLLPAPPGLTFDSGDPVTAISQPINLAHAVYTGLEFSGTAPFADDLSATANYAIQSAYPTGVDAATSSELGIVVNNQQFLGVPLHKLGWSVNYQNPAHTNAFFGANYFATGNAYNQAPFWVYNAGTNIPLGGNTLHVAWTNIFNKNAGLWPAFNFGVPVLAAPGYKLSCNGPTNPLYCTTGYNTAPHMLMVTFDHRWGSLR